MTDGYPRDPGPHDPGQQDADDPITIPPPTPVRAAAFSILGQAAAVVVLAVVVMAARQDLDVVWALGTAGYFVVLAGLMVLVALGLLRGRRWARTPGIVIDLIVGLCGFYLAVPSGQPLWGVAVILVGAGTVALLLSSAANAWISSFPSLFGEAPDR